MSYQVFLDQNTSLGSDRMLSGEYVGLVLLAHRYETKLFPSANSSEQQPEITVIRRYIHGNGGD